MLILDFGLKYLDLAAVMRITNSLILEYPRQGALGRSNREYQTYHFFVLISFSPIPDRLSITSSPQLYKYPHPPK